MGNAKNTLRSQTVRCPHCGEYYSVTYKYCPFCDAGRQEEERKQAEKKKQKQAFFSNLFGGQEPEKKPKKPMPSSSDKEERPRRPQREHPGRETAVDRDRLERDTTGRSRGERSRTARDLSREASPPEQPVRGHTERERGNKERVVKEPKEHGKPKESVNKEPKERVSKEPKESVMEPAQETLRGTHHHGHRKKTSEMTPEEKAASLADREARAAARKRERDRLAREAALAEVQATPSQEKVDTGLTAQPTPVETGPVFEDVTVPETFGLMEELPEQPQAAVFVGDGAGGENLIEVPTVPENIEEPQRERNPEAPEIPVVPAAPAESDAAVVPASTETAVEEEPTWETIRDLGVLAPAIEAALQEESGNKESGNGQADQPAQEENPVVQPEGSEVAAEPAEDLDTLLSEIRDLLEESPVPALSAEQLQKPVVPEQAVQLQEELEPAAPDGVSDTPIEPEVQKDQEAPQTEPEVPAAEEMEEELPQVDEPTISLGPLLSREGGVASEEKESALAEPVADDAPTQVIPSQEIKEELLAQEEKANGEDSQEKKHKERKKSKVILMIASLLIVALAIFIVGHKVVPMLQNGIFSQKTTQAAESVTLDKTTLDLAEAGTTMTLVPTVAPEGAKASFTWASSVPTVATVDEKGTVTAVAPGTTVISVVLENGQKAECTVSCTWNGEAGQPPAVPAGPALSAKDITLDKAGATKQITVEGTEEQITWSSSTPTVASVSPDGTVTAVDIGQAIVSAKVGEETLNCTVRCVW